MPVMPFCLTNRFKKDWEEFWSRQTEPAPDQTTVLRESTAVTDFTGYTEQPLDGAEFWAHPSMPTDVVVVRLEEAKAVVIAIRRKAVSYAPLVKTIRKAKSVEPMPEAGDEPVGGTAKEKRVWVIQAQRTLEKWTNRHPDHPDRQNAVVRVAELQARSRALYAEVTAGYLAELSSVTDPVAASDMVAGVGANDFTCWLVGEVVRLSAEVRELRGSVAMKADNGTALMFRNATQRNV